VGNIATGRSDKFHTYDGVKIVPDLHVFVNDWVWTEVSDWEFKKWPDGKGGEIADVERETFDGWYKCKNGSVYNGERMTTVCPGCRKGRDLCHLNQP
jgi:hypothetical protein